MAIAHSATPETRAYRKVTLRLLPFLMLCYVAAYLDRVNVGFAKLEMLGDLGFSETAYGLGAGMFFIGYFLFEVPSNIILHRVGARIWIGRIMISWGVVSALFMFTKTPLMFYSLRFALGLAEAGFFPGIILYLTYWYPSERRARMISLFMTAIPVILCLTVAAAGILTCAPLFWSLPTALLGGAAAAAGIAAINSVGNLAGFVSPYVVGWLKDVTSSTAAGMVAVSAVLVFGAFVVLSVPPRLVNR